MGKAKRKRARLNKARKKYKPVAMQSHSKFKRKKLAYLCNQFAYRGVGEKT